MVLFFPGLAGCSSRGVAEGCKDSCPCCQDIVQSHSKHLLSLDRWFYIEMAFVEHLAKDGGEQELQRLYRQRCFAADGRDVAQAHRAAVALMGEELYQRVGQQAQNGIKAATAMLKQVLSGQPASVSANASKFLKAVQSDLPNFVTEAAGAQGSGDSGETLRGVAALKRKFARVQKEKKPEMKELEALCVHSVAAFNEEERKVIMSMRDASLTQMPKPVKAEVAKSRAKRRAPEAFDGNAQVMKLLEG